MSENSKPLVSVDIGGTKILTAIISSNGQILAREHVPTLAEQGPNAVIERIFMSIRQVLTRWDMPLSEVAGVAVAAAGGIETSSGVVTWSPNLPGWQNIPLGDIVRTKLNTPTLIIHDAGAAAVGEHRFGAGKSTSNMVFLTVSTGIGGGVIIDGKLYNGHNGTAGEIGHMTIDVNGPPCPCGNTGCLEMLASGHALAREAVKRIDNGGKSSILEIAGGRIENITGEMVGKAAQLGDELAIEALNQISFYLGVGLTGIVNIFNPEAIVIGGGVSKLGELLLGPARAVVTERAFPLPGTTVKIATAELGEEAGIIGAAHYFRFNH